MIKKIFLLALILFLIISFWIVREDKSIEFFRKNKTNRTNRTQENTRLNYKEDNIEKYFNTQLLLEEKMKKTEYKLDEISECQEKMEEYLECMDEYNRKLERYYECIKDQTDPYALRYGSPCFKPFNFCSKPICF